MADTAIDSAIERARKTQQRQQQAARHCIGGAKKKAMLQNSADAASQIVIGLEVHRATMAELIAELDQAHRIIGIALNCFSDDTKFKFVQRVCAAGLDGDGVTRANERESLLARVQGAPTPAIDPQPYERGERGERGYVARVAEGAP